MAKKSTLRDRVQWAAPWAALAISAISLCLGFYWHRQEVEDRVLVRIGAVRNHYKGGTESPEGNLYAQVVNIGARPIFVRRVELVIGNGRTIFFGGDNLTGANGELRRLAPGEEADFKTGWDPLQSPLYFDARSNSFRLTNEKGRDAGASLYVETTRATFDQAANIHEVKDAYTDTLLPKPVVHPPSWHPPSRPRPPVIKSLTIHTEP
jgi:hypothetical protein